MHKPLRSTPTDAAPVAAACDGLSCPRPPPPPSRLSDAIVSPRKARQVSRCLTSPARPAPRARLLTSLSSLEHTDGIKMDDVVGSGVCGVLYKWVNYGRGWRRRWFVFNDGVLSFYNIHGPEKIVVRNVEEIGGKLIGQESFRRMCTRRGSSSSSSSSSSSRYRSRCGRPAGEIHLKISTIRESRSDEKRFTIYTGTKTIHLRADTREARDMWLEALYAAKEMFPRVSKGGLVNVPEDDLSVSTEKLRARLLQEGVCEVALQDCEQIMRDEFSSLHNQLLAMRQKKFLLLDTISHLEAEKVDLENTFLDQINIPGISHGACRRAHGCRMNGTDDNNVQYDNHEDDEDDMDERFRDTKEFLSPYSSDSSESEFQGSSLDSDEEDNHEMDDSFMTMHTYPYVKRRKKLPDPAETEKGVSLWSIIKDNIGKDLTKICLPVYFNEPISSLQKGFEDLEYSYLIDKAYEWGKKGNSVMRMLNVAAFAVSGYASTEGRICKPFNPLLGETYEADYPDKGIRFISEKVSHHPMVIACHCDGRGWKFWGECNLKNKFQGRSITIDPVGLLTVEFDDGEVYQWSKVTTSIYNLIIGKVYCDHYGTMHIQGANGQSCKIKFKEQSFIDRNPHQVHGNVVDKNGKTIAKLFGKWDENLYYVDGENLKKGRDSDSRSHSRLLWRTNKPPKFRSRYNLTRFAITLNELTPDLKEMLPPTDSRLRPDQRHLENGEYELANTEKLRLEERQREARKIQEKGWKPRWFKSDKDGKGYRYVGGYWEAKNEGKWVSCPQIFGDISVV